MKKTLIIFFSALFLGFSLIISTLISGQKTKPSSLASPFSDQNIIKPLASTSVLSSTRQKTKVTRVIDGDTIEIEGGQKIRYIGIDTPETVHPDKSLECFGIEASNKNKELVEGKENDHCPKKK